LNYHRFLSEKSSSLVVFRLPVPPLDSQSRPPLDFMFPINPMDFANYLHEKFQPPFVPEPLNLVKAEPPFLDFLREFMLLLHHHLIMALDVVERGDPEVNDRFPE
jgi:hypothetical protein